MTGRSLPGDLQRLLGAGGAAGVRPPGASISKAHAGAARGRAARLPPPPRGPRPAPPRTPARRRREAPGLGARAPPLRAAPGPLPGPSRPAPAGLDSVPTPRRLTRCEPGPPGYFPMLSPSLKHWENTHAPGGNARPPTAEAAPARRTAARPRASPTPGSGCRRLEGAPGPGGAEGALGGRDAATSCRSPPSVRERLVVTERSGDWGHLLCKSESWKFAHTRSAVNFTDTSPLWRPGCQGDERRAFPPPPCTRGADSIFGMLERKVRHAGSQGKGLDSVGPRSQVPLCHFHLLPGLPDPATTEA